MVGQGVAVVLQAVQAGFTEFQQGLNGWVPQIFLGWGSDEQAEIMQWFSQPTPVYFSIAYPLQPDLMPSCAVSMEAGAEEPGADAFGMFQGNAKDALGNPVQWSGVTAHDRFDISLRHATNQKLLLWLDIVTWWSLMAQRQTLLRAGMGQQVLSRSGIEPDPWYVTSGSLPVFRRIVSLTVRHQLGYYEPVPSVSSIQGTATPHA